MDTQRLILFFIFGFSVLMLWAAWEREHRPKPVPAAPASVQGPAAPSSPAKPGAAPVAAPKAAPGVPNAAAPSLRGETIEVRTDLMVAQIDTLGATLKH